MAQSANLGPAVHIPPPPRRPRVFYGWFVVLAAFTVTFLGFGSAIPFLGLYGASKHAVEAMTDSYRYELSQLGIDVVLIQPGPYPTKLYTAIQKPSDAGRADRYGDVAALPGKFAEFLQGVFSVAKAPDPHDVATALAKLIETPAGQRPDRVIVGAAFGADFANSAIQPIQGQLISGVGFDHLSKLKVV